MNCFALTLLDCHGERHFGQIRQFIGADNSGSFGIMAGHAHLLAILRFGLARFCDNSGVWYYLALPGGVVRFYQNKLTVTTVRFFLGNDREQICQQLAEQMAQLDSEIHAAHATMLEIEHTLLQRLAELSKQGSGVVT